MKNGKRRGATKVPNVILRPVPSIPNSKGTSTLIATQRDINEPGELNFREGSSPLRGVILCATGKLDKATLFAHAQQLGATRSNDFTDLVTHLVADAPGSAKYECAVQRNLPILRESWVHDIYNAWLAGNAIDLNQFIDKHRLPIFTGVQLCITGIQNAESRERIATILREQGGIYSKSLDLSTTHLLCSEPASDEITQAKQINQEPGRKGIFVIWEEWFWDCLDFNGRWNEKLYDINIPQHTKKWEKPERQKMNKQVTILRADTVSEVNSLPTSLPSSCLTRGDDTPELGQIQKQKGIGLRVFRNIVRSRRFPHNKRDDSTPDLSIDAVASVETNAVTSEEHGTSSVLDTKPDFQKDAPFFAASPSQPISQLSMSSKFLVGSSVNTAESISSHPIPDNVVTNIFAGHSFRPLGEAKEGALLRDAINKHGGRWLDSDGTSAEPDFFLVRLAGGNAFWNEANLEDRSKFRTECWVERSILEERMCRANEHITFTPLNITVPVEGSEKLFVSLSGLDSAETYWAKRLLRAVGANVQSAFSKSTSHLICPSGHGEKFQKAREWKIPIVNLGWLFSIAKNGKLPVHSDFEVRADCLPSVVHASKHVSSVFQSRSKEKAPELQERGRRIIGVTNSKLSPLSKIFADVPDSADHSQEILPCMPPDSSLRPSEISSTTGSLTVYPALFPASTNSTTSFSPIETEMYTELTFGEPIGLRVPGSPAAIQNDDMQGCFLQSSHPPKGPKTENKKTQIPSSSSPSPLQIITTSSTRTLSPISETRGLRTAITALLGKRAPECKSDDLAVQKRPTKRPRPHTRSLKEPDIPMPSLISLVTMSPPLSSLTNKEESTPNEEESNLGVIYEDPDQREEKRRLIALFEKSSVVSGNADDLSMQGYVKRPDEIPETSKRKKTVRRLNRSGEGKG